MLVSEDDYSQSLEAICTLYQNKVAYFFKASRTTSFSSLLKCSLIKYDIICEQLFLQLCHIRWSREYLSITFPYQLGTSHRSQPHSTGEAQTRVCAFQIILEFCLPWILILFDLYFQLNTVIKFMKLHVIILWACGHYHNTNHPRESDYTLKAILNHSIHIYV